MGCKGREEVGQTAGESCKALAYGHGGRITKCTPAWEGLGWVGVVLAEEVCAGGSVLLVRLHYFSL